MLLVGVGGLGTPVASYLVRCGVGELILVDDDVVALSNLHRQVLFVEEDVGDNKAEAAARYLAKANVLVKTRVVAERIDYSKLGKYVEGVHMVVDCCDNFPTRYAVNRVCCEFQIPLISAAAIRFEGQIAVFDTSEPHSPCYQCVFPSDTIDPGQDCSSSGVFAPLVGVLGAMQAQEAIKHLLGIGKSLVGRMLLYDALEASWHSICISRNTDCLACSYGRPLSSPTHASPVCPAKA